MKGMPKIPALEESIAAFVDALSKGDARAAQTLVSDAARDAFGHVVLPALGQGPAQAVERIGFARIGFHYMMKLRLTSAETRLTWLLRWREDNGAWRLASIEDLSGKRSPWSDVPTLANARREIGNG
jgi:hypothetical protein